MRIDGDPESWALLHKALADSRTETVRRQDQRDMASVTPEQSEAAQLYLNRVRGSIKKEQEESL